MFLREFIESVVEELRQLYENHLSMAGPTARLRKQLRVMFGRGEIDRETFFRLRARLDQGQYIEGELLSLHRQAVHRLSREKGYELALQPNRFQRSLNHVYLNLAQLEEARLQMWGARKTLERQREWNHSHAQDCWNRAQAALPDEALARTYLDVRRQLLEQLELIDQRTRLIGQELSKIDGLEAQLRFYESELVLMQSRERLALEELSIQEHLQLTE